MLSEFLRKKEQVVLIECAYFDQVGVFLVGDIRFFVGADNELL